MIGKDVDEAEVERMMLYLNYIHDSEKNGSVFMIEGRGGPNEKWHLQGRFRNRVAEAFVRSNVQPMDDRFIDAIIESLIAEGFFGKPKTEDEVTLAVNIILTFIDVKHLVWRKVYRRLQKES